MEENNIHDIGDDVLKEESSQKSFVVGKIQDLLSTSNITEFLPGQICSTDQTQCSSSADFDIEIFRNQHNKTINTNNSNQTIELDKSKLAADESSYLKFLGIQFKVSILQERNYDSILFLKCVASCNMLIAFSNFVTFAVGLNYLIFPLICQFGASIVFVVFSVEMCKKSIKHGPKIQLTLVIETVLAGAFYMGLFLYSLLVKIPFNSLPLYILLYYLNLLIASVTAGLVILPNNISYDDPNYQLKFFAKLFISAFFNATGMLDALSDIVLGIELVTYPSQKLFIIGIILFVLCNIDYLQVLRKIAFPLKIMLYDYIFNVVVEAVVLVLTAIVLFDVSHNSESEQQENTFFATVISISTTIVNFSHNFILLYKEIRPDTIGLF
eukprot:TRINITY_DN5019_c0_g1_i5.p2 TRINITY_DN5019_c0_g1~~TRINITY_DN5019_c0_g1_i5.p2  ORF type:complete len:383 (-),score=3.84 TRINITY_DN5019_c0_g1_i5:362-1510(-)